MFFYFLLDLHKVYVNFSYFFPLSCLQPYVRILLSPAYHFKFPSAVCYFLHCSIGRTKLLLPCSLSDFPSWSPLSSTFPVSHPQVFTYKCFFFKYTIRLPHSCVRFGSFPMYFMAAPVTFTASNRFFSSIDLYLSSQNRCHLPAEESIPTA